MTSIVVVDDHPVVRAGIRQVLHATDDLRVTAEGSTGADALRLAARHHPDALVLDVNLPDLSGMHLTRQLRLVGPRPAILILTVHNDRETIFGRLHHERPT